MVLSRWASTRGRLATLTLLALAALPLRAHAQTAAIDFATAGSGAVSTTSTRGFLFNITSPITVTGLSVYDLDSDGLADSHQVGLWDSAGTLLASLTVPSGTGAPLDSSGKFRYVNLPSSVTLPVATGYRVGALMNADTSDFTFFSQTGLTSISGVTYVSGAFIFAGTLTRPTNNISSGLSGGSFVVSSGGGVAPEPGTLAFLTLGILGGAVARRRRK